MNIQTDERNTLFNKSNEQELLTYGVYIRWFGYWVSIPWFYFNGLCVTLSVIKRSKFCNKNSKRGQFVTY